MKRTLTYILLIVAMVLGTSCERRELYDNNGGNLYLEIDIETESSRGEQPAGMLVGFFNPESHSNVYTTFVSYTGGFISILPDTYDLMVYNYDTEYTQLRNENVRHQVEAYTNEVPTRVRRTFESTMRTLAASRIESSRSYADNPIIQQPDHLYVGMIDRVEVPVSIDGDEVKRVHVTARSIIETYHLEISGIEGSDNISTVEVFVSGQAASKRLFDRTPLGGPATLYLPLRATRSDILRSDFTTFGKMPGDDNRAFVILRISNSDGEVFTWEWDVTDQFANEDHIIRVSDNIVIPAPVSPGGGFSPEVVDWDEETAKVTL